MILQSLVHLYDELSRQGKVAKEGWGIAKVSHRLVINTSGQLIGIISARRKVLRGKKEKEIPTEMIVPLPVIRAVGIKANFLCDSSSYMLGVDDKGKPERTRKCFEASKELHHHILDHCTSMEAKAILAFFDSWDVTKALDNHFVKDNLDDILAGSNFLLQIDGTDATEVPEIREAWEKYYNGTGSGEADSAVGPCLVTGKENQPIAVLHPKIKGVMGAQSSGANLVSFNAAAFCSYGHDGEQGKNAPVSEEAALAYGTALNYLLADDRHRKIFGDTTVVYWSEHAADVYQDCFMDMLGDDSGIGDKELDDILASIKNGVPADLNGVTIDPEEPFYILGLAPSAARISVRFFFRNTFGNVISALEAHQERMRLVHASWEKDRIPLWQILKATANPHSKDSASSPLLAGSLMVSIFNNSRYPEAVYQNILRRIYSDRDEAADAGKKAIQKVSYVKAVFIKACLLKNYQKDWEGKIQMAVNEKCNDVSYVLGRLFSVLENIQQAANPNINTTIKDRYFNSACATPASVFPVLLKLANAHLGKLDQPKAVFFKKKLGALMDKIVMPDTGTPLPHRLTLDEQGAFVLGYYQETQERFAGKKEEK